MATLGVAVNFTDVAKRTDPDGSIGTVIELLADDNEIMADGMIAEGNMTNGHKTIQRTGLPTVYWRRLNQGIPTSKSKTKQVTDECGMLEAFSEIDVELADLNGNTAEFRLSEDMAYIESLNQEMGDTTFYGDSTVNEEEFHGLAPRYSSLSAANAANILDAAGTGSDNTSIWLITWGSNTCHYIYPKKSEVGLTHEDLGKERVYDASNNSYMAYVTHWKWKLGITLRDWRSVVRICNIDVSNLTKDKSGSSADIPDLMVQAIEKLKGTGRLAFYCNRTIRSILRRQIINSNNVHISMMEIAGKKVVAFDEIPVRMCEAILDTESRVT